MTDPSTGWGPIHRAKTLPINKSGSQNIGWNTSYTLANHTFLLNANSWWLTLLIVQFRRSGSRLVTDQGSLPTATHGYFIIYTLTTFTIHPHLPVASHSRWSRHEETASEEEIVPQTAPYFNLSRASASHSLHTVFTQSAPSNTVTFARLSQCQQKDEYVNSENRCGHTALVAGSKVKIAPTCPNPKLSAWIRFRPRHSRVAMAESGWSWATLGSFFSSAVWRRLVKWKMAAAVTEELVKDREFGVLYLEVSTCGWTYRYPKSFIHKQLSRATNIDVPWCISSSLRGFRISQKELHVQLYKT